MKRKLLFSATGVEKKMTRSYLQGLLFLIAFLIFDLGVVRSQGRVAEDYTFAASTAPAYTNMVGGTSVIPVGISFGHSVATNVNALNIPIGFNFVFNNAVNSTVSISDNGYITFGSVSPAGGTGPISAATAYTGAIAAFGANLAGNIVTGSSIAFSADGADIKYLTTGTAPNQVFTVEFKNMKRRNLTTNTDGFLNFQIRLYESNMRIEIVYRNFTSAVANSTQGQVGLRGLTNTDFNNRLAGGSANWYPTAAGAANGANLAITNTVGPNAAGAGAGNDTVFTWTPTCFNPTALVANLQVDNTTVNFSWSPAAFLTAGFVDYTWEVRTSGLPGSGPAGLFASGSTALASESVTGLLVGIPYTFYVKSNCKAWTSVTIITATVTPSCSTPVFPYNENFEGVTAPAIPPCTSTVITTGTAAMRTRDAASAILFPPLTPIGPYGGFANKNLITSNTANQDTWFFTRGISLISGTTYRVSYKYGGSRELAQFSQRLRVCIGTSATAVAMTTLLADHQSIKSTPNSFTFHFVAATTGTFFLGMNGVAAFNNGYLQIDDISLNTPTCSPPTGLTAGAITYNSAVMSWTAPSPAPTAGYEYIISTAVTPPISTTIVSGANLGTVTTFTGLLSNTLYNVWVRSNCGGEYSAWSPLSSFSTLPAPPAPCTPAPSSTDGQGITNVTFGSINNTTGSEPGFFGNYTAFTTNIAQTQSIPIAVTYRTGFTYNTRIWIDWNNDGVFDNNIGSAELVATGVSGSAIPTTLDLNFVVPISVPGVANTAGPHRMRIGGADINDLSGTGVGQGPCYTGAFGSFEDYTVFVTAPPPPLTLSSSSTSFCNGGTSPLVTLNFNAHSGVPALRYDNFVWNPSTGVTGTPTGGYTFSPTNPGVNVFTLTATQASSPFYSNTVTYTVTVNDVPSPIVFTPTTLNVCENIPTALTSTGGVVTGAVIFEENFNSPDVFTRVQDLIPPGIVPYGPWTAFNTSTGGNRLGPAGAEWLLRTSPHLVPFNSNIVTSNDASQFIMSNSDLQGSGGITNTELVTPPFSLVGYTNISLNFWQRYRDLGGTAEVQITDDSDATINNGEVWTTLVVYNSNIGADSAFVNEIIDLSAFAGGSNVRIKFKYINAPFAWYWCIDNVKITGSTPANLTWAPTTGLFLDSGGTVPYTGAAVPVVYARLTNDVTYTATAAALAPPFCSTSNTLNVTVTKAGVATGNQVLACGDSTLSSNITLTGYVPALAATITGWQMADNPSFIGATTVPGSAGKDVLTPADVSGLSVTTYFRAMILGCPTLYSNVITVSYPTATWNGSWSPGVPGPTDNVTVASGTLNITSDLTICSLRIQNNAIVNVNPGVTLTVNGTVIVVGGAPGGRLNFLDDNTFTLGAASLMQNPATTINSNTGVASYQRWTKTRKFDYTYWSAPLNQTTLFTVSPTTLADKFLRFDSNAYNWITMNAALTTMTPGVGYAIRGPQAYSETVLTNYLATFGGTPNNGNINVTLFRPSATNDLNLVGNPYPSAIDADLLMDGNVGTLGAAGVGTTFYFWTHNTQYVGGNYVFSDYAAYNRTGGVGTAPGTFVAGGNNAVPNGFISAGQGFMVKAMAAGTMTFRNNMRVAANNVQFFRMNNSNAKSRIWLNYTNVNDSEEFKQLLVGYIPNATNAYEDGFDGEVIVAGSSIAFYSLADADSKHLMIQGRALPFTSDDRVALGYQASAASTYQISLSNQDGLFEDETVGIYLEDMLTGVVHDLRLAPYQFVTEAGAFENRFVLRYNNNMLGVDQGTWNENNVVVFKQNEQIQIESALVPLKTVKVFDVQGRLVMEKNQINSQTVSLQKVGLANQVLMVQITSVDGVTVLKKIIF